MDNTTNVRGLALVRQRIWAAADTAVAAPAEPLQGVDLTLTFHKSASFDFGK